MLGKQLLAYTILMIVAIAVATAIINYGVWNTFVYISVGTLFVSIGISIMSMVVWAINQLKG